MSDWKSRATPVTDNKPSSDWKSRATPVSSDSDKGEISTLLSDPVKYAKDRIQDAKDELIGVGQGATAGWGDEIKGAGDTALDALKGNVDPTNLDDILSTFRKHQKENEAGVDEAKARSPKAVLGSELAGGLIPGFLTAGGSEAVTGANAAKTLGQLALENAPKAALFGGVAGAGGSRGNLDSIEGMNELAKDTAFGTGGGLLLGGASPYGGKMLSAGAGLIGDAGSAVGGLAKKPLNALAQFIEDSPTLKNFNDARRLKRITGQSFTGTPNIKNTNDNINAIIDDVANKASNLKGELGDYYGGMLDDATAAGDKLSTTDQALMDKMEAAKNLISGTKTDPQTVAQNVKTSFDQQINPLTLGTEEVANSTMSAPKTIPGKDIPGRGGLSPEMQALLAKHGQATGDSLSNSAPSALNPNEAKTLQNALREAANKPGYKDTNVINDLVQQLTPAIDNSMSSELLPTTNAKYKDGMNVIESLLNKGETDAGQQKIDARELDPEDLKAKVADYISGVVNKKRDSNIQGGVVNSDFDRVISKIKDLNKSNQTQYLDPDQISKSVDDAALQSKILKSIYGEKANGQSSGLITKAIDLVTRAPMRGALGVGGLQRTADKVGNTIAVGGRNLFQSTNEGLSTVVQSLTGAGHVDIANSLGKALTSGDNGAKNAALFTIMQNPNYRKAVFGDDESSEGSK